MCLLGLRAERRPSAVPHSKPQSLPGQGSGANLPVSSAESHAGVTSLGPQNGPREGCRQLPRTLLRQPVDRAGRPPPGATDPCTPQIADAPEEHPNPLGSWQSGPFRLPAGHIRSPGFRPSGWRGGGPRSRPKLFPARQRWGRRPGPLSPEQQAAHPAAARGQKRHPPTPFLSLAAPHAAHSAGPLAHGPTRPLGGRSSVAEVVSEQETHTARHAINTAPAGWHLPDAIPEAHVHARIPQACTRM